MVFDLVKKHNVLDNSSISYPNVNFMCSSGLVTLCLEILKNCDELKNQKGSLGDYILREYQKALKTSEYSDIDSDTAHQVLEYFHKFENSIESSDSWFDTSASGYLDYWECEGHPLLNWKDKGYTTVFDFLTVS